jgi:hypothetical protein
LAWGDFFVEGWDFGWRGALAKTGVLRFAQNDEQQLQQQIMVTESPDGEVAANAVFLEYGRD